jgi:predicted DsbA family dithiol-disulfide isomerase
VPFFIFGNKLGVSGAQSPEILADAIDKALESAPA